LKLADRRKSAKTRARTFTATASTANREITPLAIQPAGGVEVSDLPRFSLRDSSNHFDYTDYKTVNVPASLPVLAKRLIVAISSGPPGGFG
jgi:hypothetical protein